MADNLSALEREMEETRVRLAATIDQLAHRASPKTIAKREVGAIRGYVVDPSGAPRTQNIVKVAGVVGGVVAAFVLIRKVAR